MNGRCPRKWVTCAARDPFFSIPSRPAYILREKFSKPVKSVTYEVTLFSPYSNTLKSSSLISSHQKATPSLSLRICFFRTLK